MFSFLRCSRFISSESLRLVQGMKDKLYTVGNLVKGGSFRTDAV